MKITIRKNNFLYFYIGLCLGLFSATGQLLNYIIPLSSIRTLLGVSLLFILVLMLIKIKVISEKHQIASAFLLVCMGTLILYNDDWWNIYNISIFLIMLLLCFFSYYTNKWIKYYFEIVFGIYTIYAICTIVFYFTRDLYLNTIVNLFPDTRQRLIEWYNSGCMAGLTEHYSTNAMFLTVGLFIAITGCSYLLKNKKIKGFFITLFIVALLLTGKRGHIVFACAAIFALYYFSLSKEKGINRGLKFIGIILIILCIGSIVLPMIPALSTFIERFRLSIASGDISTNRTGLLWPLAIQGFKQSPLFGLGWCQYTSSLSEQIVGRGIYYHAHNVYLQLLCDTGVVGFSIYFIWMIRSVLNTLKNYKAIIAKDIYNNIIKSQMAFSLGFQLFFLLYNFTGNALYDKEMFIPYFAACAINLYYSSHLIMKSSIQKNKGVQYTNKRYAL